MAEVVLAREYGLCEGSKDSLEAAIRLASERGHGKIFTFGQLLNNEAIISYLQGLGVGFIDVGSYAPGKYDPQLVKDAICRIPADSSIIITAHGIERELVDSITKKIGADNVFDLTCARGVKFAQATASKFFKQGYGVVLVTTEENRFHPEVRGIKSFASNGNSDNFYILTSREQAYSKAFFDFLINQDFGIGMIAKTTEDELKFDELSTLVKKLIGDKWLPVVFESKKTICRATRDRQDAARELVRDGIDAAVVVGDVRSANTIALAKLLEQGGVKVYLALGWPALAKNEAELKKYAKIGVTAGASALPSYVDAVVERLRTL